MMQRAGITDVKRAVIHRIFLITICFCVVLPGKGYCQDTQRLVRSAVFPGMGQLGDAQTLKGLAFMTGEVVYISIAVGEYSKSRAFALETRKLKIDFKMGASFERLVEIHDDWESAYNRSNSARQRVGILIGTAVALWGLNIVDAIMFPPRGNHDDSTVSSLFHNILHNTSVHAEEGGCGIRLHLPIKGGRS